MTDLGIIETFPCNIKDIFDKYIYKVRDLKLQTVDSRQFEPKPIEFGRNRPINAPGRKYSLHKNKDTILCFVMKSEISG